MLVKHEQKGEHPKVTGSILSIPITSKTFDLLDGTDGVLKNHDLFSGLSKSTFLRFALAFVFHHKPTDKEFALLIKASSKPEPFEEFMKSIKRSQK